MVSWAVFLHLEINSSLILSKIKQIFIENITMAKLNTEIIGNRECMRLKYIM